MDGRESSGEIARAAAAWVARMDRAPLCAADQARLRHWLAADIRRRGALVRAQALWLKAAAAANALPPARLPDPANATVQAPPRARHGSARRRTLLRWSGAAAASLMLAVLLFVSVPVPTAYATAKGEMRRVPLADGSTLTLNTQSRVRIHQDDGHLRVQVVRGEVFFEAAANATPLRVEVDGRRFDANAAAFAVRRLDGQPAQIVVQNGRLDAVDGNAGGARIGANMRLSIPPGRGKVAPTPLSATDLQQELAWRDGKIAFRGESLAHAARSFSRYSDIRIVIADPELASEPITGLFAASNPVGFARAAAAVFGAHASQGDGVVVVSRQH
ncbi:FecR family protein [Stenotrophomonas acidaminiphila]|uniref:FecR family protein n=1 Tax=Stenotrophomonas acidaminiphila TaxID=128780 RepID=UPI0015F7C245|nr:FecR domain-containing protein [Stenotrophomonas acidaminiphila]